MAGERIDAGGVMAGPERPPELPRVRTAPRPLPLHVRLVALARRALPWRGRGPR